MHSIRRIVMFIALTAVVVFFRPSFSADVDVTVKSTQKISDTQGAFGGALSNEDRFGSVRSIGDLDGDGTIDVAIGAHGDDDGGVDRGALWIVFLNSDATVKSEQKISDLSGGFAGTLANGDRFGIAAAPLGDLDGDDVMDLAVGAYLDSQDSLNQGGVWILFMNGDGTVKDEQKIARNQGGFVGQLNAGDQFGRELIGLGDQDGDGVCDLAVGAIGDDDGSVNPSADHGAVWILFLNTDGTVKAHQKISNTEGGFAGNLGDDDNFGSSLAVLDDVDGDGMVDLAVGAYETSDAGDQRGAVWVLMLNMDGTVKDHQKISDTMGGFTGDLDDGDRFGFSVGALSDLDENGVRDLAVGAIRDDDGGDDRGAVWVLFLNNDGTAKSHSKISSTSGGGGLTLDDGDVFGISVSSLGDVDGDGVEDLAVGASGDDDGGAGASSDRGAVWVLFLDDEIAPVQPFLITSIVDVDNDQGRNVRITFNRSSRDILNSETPIIQYEAYRRIDPLAFVTDIRAPDSRGETAQLHQGSALDGWEFSGAIPAHGETVYNMIVPTLADKTNQSGIHWSVFYIRAATAQPLVFFDSPPDSGYSVDNLPPGPPGAFSVSHLSGVGNQLQWESPGDADIKSFHIYREMAPEFTPTAGNFIQATIDLEWLDPVAEGWRYYYKITTVDHSGNESRESDVGRVTAIPNISEQPGLYQNNPNPFNPSTIIQYNLPPAGSDVFLAIFDVSGRTVRTLVSGHQSGGRKTAVWDGRDDRGQQVSSGVYFYRLRALGYDKTLKMTLVQ